MNVKKCSNGHFFDNDKYAQCPLCGAAPIDAAGRDAAVKTKADKKKNARLVEMPKGTIGKTMGIFEETPKDSGKEDAVKAPQSAKEPEMVFCGYCGQRYNKNEHHDCKEKAAAVEKSGRASAQNDVDNKVVPQKEEPKKEASSLKSVVNQAITGDTENIKRMPMTSVMQEQPSSLQTAVKEAVSSGGNKTIGFFSIQSQSNITAVQEPLVGWLVGVKGPYFGQALAFTAGRNAVGRDDTNAIVLANDEAVSRNKHFWIIYDPKNREFFVQPGDGSGLIYVNGELLLQTQKLQQRDIVEFGQGGYLFVPLCDETFSWEEYMNKE